MKKPLLNFIQIELLIEYNFIWFKYKMPKYMYARTDILRA
jgi:hypothetical protein